MRNHPIVIPFVSFATYNILVCIYIIMSHWWKVFGSYCNVYGFPRSGWSNRVRSLRKQLVILPFISLAIENSEICAYYNMCLILIHGIITAWLDGCMKQTKIKRRIYHQWFFFFYDIIPMVMYSFYWHNI